MNGSDPENFVTRDQLDRIQTEADMGVLSKVDERMAKVEANLHGLIKDSIRKNENNLQHCVTRKTHHDH